MIKYWRIVHSMAWQCYFYCLKPCTCIISPLRTCPYWALFCVTLPSCLTASSSIAYSTEEHQQKATCISDGKQYTICYHKTHFYFASKLVVSIKSRKFRKIVQSGKNYKLLLTVKVNLSNSLLVKQLNDQSFYHLVWILPLQYSVF